MPRRPRAACAAVVGLAGADAQRPVGRQAAGAQPRACRVLAHQPDPRDAWVRTWRTRCQAHPLALGLARNQGPRGSARRQGDGRGRWPVHPRPRARSRDAGTPRPAKDAPSAAALPLARRRTPRAHLHPRTPQRPARRARAPLAHPRRRRVGDHGRRIPRRTGARQHDSPHGRHRSHDPDTLLCGDVLAPWPPRKAGPRARRATLERCCRAHHGRSADVITPRLGALASPGPHLRAPPLRRMGGGSHAACLWGPRLRPAPAGHGGVPSGRCPGAGVHMASASLAGLAPSHAPRGRYRSQGPATTGCTTPPQAGPGVLKTIAHAP